MLFTVAEGWGIFASVIVLLGVGATYALVEGRAKTWLEERSRVKARQLFIDAEREYNQEQTRISGSHSIR